MADVILLDGSIGQELVRRSGAAPTPLWSTRVMIDRPELVQALHADFFRAGATVATTNTYPILRDRLERVGLQDRIADLTDRAIRAAVDARDAHGSGAIAGAIGPLFGSYRPDLCPPVETAAAMYAEPLSLLADRVDLLLFETMSSVVQVEGALTAAAGVEVPVWAAISVGDEDGTRLRSGEPVTDLAPVLARHRPAAILVNCSPPEAIAAALDAVRGFGIPFGAYANGFTRIAEGFLAEFPTVDALQAREDLDPSAYARFALGWVEQGATIVGGCCEVGPDHIAELARQLRAAGHRIVQP